MRDHTPTTLARARRLRKTLSPPELKLWLALKQAAAPDRSPFRKQHPEGPFVLDFYAPRARVCVEVDGYVHGTTGAPGRDHRRDGWLAERDIEVVRVSASAVFENAHGVALRLLELAAARTRPPPRPSGPPPPRAGED